MPTYAYICAKCSAEHRIFQRVSEAPKKKCPACGGTIKRQIGAGAGVIFKGSGFYQTDYKRSSASSNGSSSKSSGNGTSSGDKSESKPKGGSHGCGPGCGCK